MAPTYNKGQYLIRIVVKIKATPSVKTKREITFEQRQEYNKQFLEERGVGHLFVREERLGD